MSTCTIDGFFRALIGHPIKIFLFIKVVPLSNLSQHVNFYAQGHRPEFPEGLSTLKLDQDVYFGDQM